jgi:hypothetical protein
MIVPTNPPAQRGIALLEIGVLVKRLASAMSVPTLLIESRIGLGPPIDDIEALEKFKLLLFRIAHRCTS